MTRWNGVGSTPTRNRTWNLRLRRPLLYPIELSGLMRVIVGSVGLGNHFSPWIRSPLLAIRPTIQQRLPRKDQPNATKPTVRLHTGQDGGQRGFAQGSIISGNGGIWKGSRRLLCAPAVAWGAHPPEDGYGKALLFSRNHGLWGTASLCPSHPFHFGNGALSDVCSRPRPTAPRRPASTGTSGSCPLPEAPVAQAPKASATPSNRSSPTRRSSRRPPTT